MIDIVQTTTDFDLTDRIDGLVGAAKVVTTTYTASSTSERSDILFVLVHGGTYSAATGISLSQDTHVIPIAAHCTWLNVVTR